MSNIISTSQLVQNIKQSDEWVNWAVRTMYDRHKTGKGVTGRGFARKDKKRGCYLGSWVTKGNALSGNFIKQGRELAITYRKQLQAALIEQAMLEYAASREATRAAATVESHPCTTPVLRACS